MEAFLHIQGGDEKKEILLKGATSFLWFILGHGTDVRGADLSAVERLVGGVVVVEEEHVDEGDEEARGVPGD